MTSCSVLVHYYRILCHNLYGMFLSKAKQRKEGFYQLQIKVKLEEYMLYIYRTRCWCAWAGVLGEEMVLSPIQSTCWEAHRISLFELLECNMKGRFSITKSQRGPSMAWSLAHLVVVLGLVGGSSCCTSTADSFESPKTFWLSHDSTNRLSL